MLSFGGVALISFFIVMIIGSIHYLIATRSWNE